MITTTDETGRLNNYPVEPAMYLATFPSPGTTASLLVARYLSSIFAFHDGTCSLFGKLKYTEFKR